MTVDKVEILTDKISFLEKKIDRIEELLLLLVEEEYLSDEEKERIVQSDRIIKQKDFEKLIKVE
ncbi:MAG: hypothetical protein KAU62_12455 [Candidatus Heimdallarchaeota archaeon]|nr:hypothetical protein [Candidatus Heimdallarchaeota archaeon]MCK4611961.1 hypothetical protein [Candidatus Heimdallarchaeota archaeon]